MLVAAIVVTLIVAVIDWVAKLTSNARVENIAKPSTTILVMWIAIAADGPTTATVLAVTGLAFCLIGDIALLDAVDKFVVGLASFLVAHIVFIAMFVSLGLDDPAWGLAAAGVLAVHLFSVAPRIVAGAVRTDRALRTPVIVYQIAITAMAIVAAMTGEFWAIFGAVSFVISDTLLAWRAFVIDEPRAVPADDPLDASMGGPGDVSGGHPWLSVMVMMTYHAAIIGLALSLY